MDYFKKESTVVFAKISILMHIFMVIGKIVLSILSLSIFMCINAFYNIGMGIAKLFYVKGEKPFVSEEIKKKYYINIGYAIGITSIVYVLYSLRLLFGYDHSNFYFTKWQAITIATFTFVEIGFNLRGVFVAWKNESHLQHALKLTNLVSSLICLVLTQTALLSFTQAGDNSFSNGLVGVVFGGISVFIGIYMIIFMNIVIKGKNYFFISLKIKKLIRKNKLNIKIIPKKIEDDEIYKKNFYIEILDRNNTVTEDLDNNDSFIFLKEETLKLYNIILKTDR